MTKAQFRRWVVRVAEYAIYMIILFIFCLIVCLVMGSCLRILGVA